MLFSSRPASRRRAPSFTPRPDGLEDRALLSAFSIYSGNFNGNGVGNHNPVTIGNGTGSLNGNAVADDGFAVTAYSGNGNGYANGNHNTVLIGNGNGNLNGNAVSL